MKTGTYGRVTLVRDKAGGPTMALKQIQKAHIVRGGKVQNLILEKRAMQMLDHQFLLKLHRSFQDQASIFLLTEFVQGGKYFKRRSEHREWSTVVIVRVIFIR